VRSRFDTPDAGLPQGDQRFGHWAAFAEYPCAQDRHPTPTEVPTSGIVSALNSYDGTFGNVSYVGSNIVGTANPYEAFVNRIGLDLQQPNSSGYSPCIPITLMQTAKIPRYNSHASRHYMSIGGIDDTVSTMKMRSVDPNNNSAYHGVYWDPVGSTTANGLCRACYQPTWTAPTWRCAGRSYDMNGGGAASGRLAPRFRS